MSKPKKAYFILFKHYLRGVAKASTHDLERHVKAIGAEIGNTIKYDVAKIELARRKTKGST